MYLHGRKNPRLIFHEGKSFEDNGKLGKNIIPILVCEVSLWRFGGLVCIEKWSYNVTKRHLRNQNRPLKSGFWNNTGGL